MQKFEKNVEYFKRMRLVLLVDSQIRIAYYWKRYKFQQQQVKQFEAALKAKQEQLNQRTKSKKKLPTGVNNGNSAAKHQEKLAVPSTFQQQKLNNQTTQRNQQLRKGVSNHRNLVQKSSNSSQNVNLVTDNSTSQASLNRKKVNKDNGGGKNLKKEDLYSESSVGNETLNQINFELKNMGRQNHQYLQLQDLSRMPSSLQGIATARQHGTTKINKEDLGKLQRKVFQKPNNPGGKSMLMNHEKDCADDMSRSITYDKIDDTQSQQLQLQEQNSNFQLIIKDEKGDSLDDMLLSSKKHLDSTSPSVGGAANNHNAIAAAYREQFSLNRIIEEESPTSSARRKRFMLTNGESKILQEENLGADETEEEGDRSPTYHQSETSEENDDESETKSRRKQSNEKSNSTLKPLQKSLSPLQKKFQKSIQTNIIKSTAKQLTPSAVSKFGSVQGSPQQSKDNRLLKQMVDPLKKLTNQTSFKVDGVQSTSIQKPSPSPLAPQKQLSRREPPKKQGSSKNLVSNITTSSTAPLQKPAQNFMRRSTVLFQPLGALSGGKKPFGLLGGQTPLLNLAQLNSKTEGITKKPTNELVKKPTSDSEALKLDSKNSTPFKIKRMSNQKSDNSSPGLTEEYKSDTSQENEDDSSQNDASQQQITEENTVDEDNQADSTSNKGSQL